MDSYTPYRHSGFLTRENGDFQWSYGLWHPITNTDASRLSALSMPPPPPPPPTLIITFIIYFHSYDLHCPRDNGEGRNHLYATLYTTERKEFNKMNIMPFITSKSSAEDALRNMFLNTRTWNDMVSSETCSEMRESMFSELSESIFSFLDRVFDHEVSEIVFEIDVEKERVLTVDDIPEEEYDFLEYLVDSIDHELDEIEDLVDSIDHELHELHEQDSEYSCPAPQVLLESMVTEVFHKEEEAMGCVICLEELVSGTEVKRLPCFHCFHGQCIDRWFQEMDKCPMCRLTLPA